MSSGKIHLRASLILAAGFSVGAVISQDPKLFECATGAIIGTMITPDLDLSNGGIVGGKFIRQKVGWIGERAWKFFWRGYSESFKHGTWASHSIVFSTLVRIFYVYYWVILIPHIIIKLLFNPNWELIYVLEWYATIFTSPMFLYGLISSDLIHITLDRFTKESHGK